MNEEYIKYFEHFHKERLSFLSGKDKHKKCKDCDTEKVFTEEDNELIYNCGSVGSGEDKDCGEQFRIKLPEYISYVNLKRELQLKIHGANLFSRSSL